MFNLARNAEAIVATAQQSLRQRNVDVAEAENFRATADLRRREADLARREQELTARRETLDRRERQLDGDERRLARERRQQREQEEPSVPVAPRSGPVLRWSAENIIACGRRARGLDATPPPLPSHPVARAIVLAGMKARGEIRDERSLPPRGSMAWKILAAGAKARGEEFP
jgi:hypothetical protein